MNSNDTSPYTSRRILSRLSTHSTRTCNCKLCLDPATLRSMSSTSRDVAATRLSTEGNNGVDETDRRDTEGEGLPNPHSERWINKGETINIQPKPSSDKRLSFSFQSSNHNSDDSRKVKSCPSTPEAVEIKTLSFYKSIAETTKIIVRERTVELDDSRIVSQVAEKRKEPSTPERSSTLQNSKTYFGFAALITLFGIFLPILKLMSGNTVDVYDPQSFSEDLNRLRVDYKLTDEPLLSFEAGLQFIKREKSTACIILSYGDKYRVPLEDSSFVENLSSVAAKYLRDSIEAKPIILDRDELSVEDREYLQTNYKHALEDRSVMVVKHLESMPAKTAMAFHDLCDEYYPLVKNTAIILLFDTRKCDIGDTDGVRAGYVERVERCLTRQWSQIDDDELKPLLNRVINVVIDLDEVS